MSIDPILLIGGAGHVGRCTAQSLRAAHPDVPLLIGGRDHSKAKEAAAAVSNATAVTIDLEAENLGLDESPVSAVAVLFMDARIGALRFAQRRGVPHISISPGIAEIAPEVAAYMHDPHAAPIILGTEWMVGATTVSTLEIARAYRQVHEVVIGAVLDEQDAFGPAAEADLERQTKTMSAALGRRDGAYYWRTEDNAKAKVRAVDGTEMAASALSPYDVVALGTATGAPNVHFNLALGMSSTRRQGGPMSTEIIIELTGEDHAGKPLRTRHAVVHPEGQMPLTGLGVAMILERLTGLDGKQTTPAGLYFPYQLLEPVRYFARLKQSGAVVLTL